MKRIIIMVIITCLLFTSCLKESNTTIDEKDDSLPSLKKTEEKLTIEKLKKSGYEIIDNQIINIEYNDLPNAKLISALYKQDNRKQLKFFIANGDEIIYTLPEFSGNKGVSIVELKKVTNVDIDHNGKKDIVFYASANNNDPNDTVTEDICGNYLLENNLFIEGEAIWKELTIKSIYIADNAYEDKQYRSYIEDVGKYTLKIKIPSTLEQDIDSPNMYIYGNSITEYCALYGCGTLFKSNWEQYNFKELITKSHELDIRRWSADIDKYKFGKTKHGYEYAFYSYVNNEPIQENVILIKLNNIFLYNLDLTIDKYDLQIYDLEYMINSVQLIEHKKDDDISKTRPSENKINLDIFKELGCEILNDRIIDIEYNDLSNAKLVSAVYTQNNKKQLKFFVINDNEIVYTLPDSSLNQDLSILELKKISNVDINHDGKKDLVFYASFSKEGDSSNTITEDICINYLLKDNEFIESESLWKELEIEPLYITHNDNEDMMYHHYKQDTGKYTLNMELPSVLEQDNDYIHYVNMYEYSNGITRPLSILGVHTIIKASWEQYNLSELISKSHEFDIYDKWSTDADKYIYGKTKFGYEYAIDSFINDGPVRVAMILVRLNDSFLYSLQLTIDKYDLQIYDLEYFVNSIQLIEN